ncbi:hypothetical protein N7527_008678 [Penicillium freii]|nr:hypothetical protein N7527_008678 [Penicillium freii]
MLHLSSPNFTVPPGDQSVQVRIIDSTTRINNLKLGFLMEPPMEGMEYMLPLPAWSFLIEHPSGQKILYDLGVPKDLHSFSPAICEHLERQGWKVDVKEEVIDILDRNGIAANEISAIIWSHWHWDHIGDPSRFPSSTELIVGPGFKAEFLPGYPAKVDAFVRESDFAGRNLQEIDFTNSIQVGEFRAADYFGDDTIEKAQVADADSNIWFIYAHDRSLLKSVDLFPLSANGWKEKKWREKTLWAFLDEFETAAKQI